MNTSIETQLRERLGCKTLPEAIVKLCERAFLPQEKWRDRDTSGCQRQLGELYAMARAGSECSIELGHRGRLLDVTVKIRGFMYHECGAEDGILEIETFYCPSLEWLEVCDGGDWYC